jgi:hypothetical protein
MSILNVDTIQANTISSSTGTTALTIDSSGRVLRATVPAFTVWNVSGVGSLTGDFLLNTVILNNGGHYSTSTGVFTAPVSGLYYFSLTGFTENNTSGSSNIGIRRNGVQIVRTFTNEAVNTYRPFAVQCTLSLSTNDTVRPFSNIDLHSNQNPVFTGYLLG